MTASAKIPALFLTVALAASTAFPPAPVSGPLALEGRPVAALQMATPAGLLPEPSESNLGAAGPGPDEYGIYGASPDEESMVDDAMHLYERAGLTLPSLRIYVHETEDPCHGYLGLYGEGGDKRRIDICMSHRFVILHELAHAWEYHNLDDSRRQAFLERVGIEEWNDLDQPRQVRGMEHVADLIAWGIDDRPIQFMHRNIHAEDLGAYELLTGHPSPRVSHWDEAPARTRETGAPIGQPIPVARNAEWR